MKLSILIPSLFPALVDRLIQTIKKGGLDEDYEIVVCSPVRASGEHVVWVKDEAQIGCDPAIRAAFVASTGKAIIVLPDDHVVLPGALGHAWCLWNENGLMDLNMGWQPRIFGLDSVAYPLCQRSLVNTLWPFFFPYMQHFGDHSFALAARRIGVPISQCPEVCLSYPWDNRLHCAESPTKTDERTYRFGKCRIYQDFPEYSKGWEGRADFNK